MAWFKKEPKAAGGAAVTAAELETFGRFSFSPMDATPSQLQLAQNTGAEALPMGVERPRGLLDDARFSRCEWRPGSARG